MKMLTITPIGTAADAIADQTGVALTTTPFAPRHSGVAVVTLNGVTGTIVILVQGSEDDSTYTTLATINAITSDVHYANVSFYPYMRTSVTDAGSTGDFGCVLLAS